MPMRRMTVSLPDDLQAQLGQEAARRGLTVSALIREALEAHLGGTARRRRLEAAGAGRSGVGSNAARIGEIIETELVRTS
jgi:plasmid stability protein